MKPELPASILTKSQTKTLAPRKCADGWVVATIRYDDECGNGHNTFSITGEVFDTKEHAVNRNYGRGERYLVMAGCVHDEFIEAWPELAHLVKWHLCSSDGPMHYVANTLYHAKEISKHQDKFHVWIDNPDLDIGKSSLGILSGEELEQVKCDLVDRKTGWRVIQKEWFNPMAKKPDLGAARRSAIWSHGTLDQLRSEKRLLERLPALMAEFKRDIESIGFIY